MPASHPSPPPPLILLLLARLALGAGLWPAPSLGPALLSSFGSPSPAPLGAAWPGGMIQLGPVFWAPASLESSPGRPVRLGELGAALGFSPPGVLLPQLFPGLAAPPTTC